MTSSSVQSVKLGAAGTDTLLLTAEDVARQFLGAGNTVENALGEAGFVRNAELKDAYTAKAVKENLSHNGDYVVQDVWTKGIVTLLFEQNTALETLGGLSAAVLHPAVCIASSPTGKVACNAEDVGLILSVAAELG